MPKESRGKSKIAKNDVPDRIPCFPTSYPDYNLKVVVFLCVDRLPYTPPTPSTPPPMPKFHLPTSLHTKYNSSPLSPLSLHTDPSTVHTRDMCEHQTFHAPPRPPSPSNPKMFMPNHFPSTPSPSSTPSPHLHMFEFHTSKIRCKLRNITHLGETNAF